MVVRLSGDLDRVRAEAALQGVDADIAIIDLTDVQFIDGGALGALVGLKKRLRTSGRLGILRIVTANPRFHRLFEMTGLDKVFHMHRSLPSAQTA
jgi:anti-sigma B factor antagonist